MINSPHYIDSLTPLRGIAALWVVVFHYNAFLEYGQLPTLTTHGESMLIGNGYLFVDFFFLLSGFIITHVYASKLCMKEKGAIKNYLWARFTRLYPLHLFCMLLLFVFACLLSTFQFEYWQQEWKPFFPIKHFFAFLTFGVSFGLTEGYSWNLPAWSIAAEWWAYIAAIGIIPWVHNKNQTRTTIVGILTLFGLILLTLVNGKNNLDYTLDFGALRCLLEFTFGVALYQIYISRLKKQSICSTDKAFVTATIIALALLHFDIHDVLLIPSFSFIILCAALNNGRVQTILNARPLKFLGEISYSMYLLHFFWLFCWTSWYDLYWKVGNVGVDPSYLQLLTWLAIIITCLILSSAVTYRYIEVAGRNFLRKIY